MLSQIACRLQLPLIVVIAISMQAVGVCHAKEPSVARPYFLFYITSLDRLLDDFEIVFESVGRADLSKSLESRLKGVRNFSGIDHTKPLGMMSTWEEEERADVVFLPIEEIDELLKTATFEIVGYHSAGPNRYEIERPGSPYHVLIRNGYAMFAEAVSTIQALRVTPEQLIREYKDRFEVGLVLDLKQIPQVTKTRFVKGLRDQVEPWLQMQDDEEKETANLRRTFGGIVLDLIERTILDMNSWTIGAHLDPDTHHFILEATMEAVGNSPTAIALNRWSAHRSEFSALVSPGVPAGIAINLPLRGLVDQIVGRASGRNDKDSNLNAGMQLVGDALGQLTLIAALSGDDARALNEALPELIIKLEKSGRFLSVCENFDVHRGVILHSTVPREFPESITYLVGSDPEIVVGQGKKIFWIGVGQPDLVVEHLKDAIDQLEDPTAVRPGSPLVRARFQAAQVPELVGANLLTPNVNPEVTKAEFSKGNDGFSLIVEPIENGIRLRLEAEEGFVRLLGRDWITQIENANR